MVGSIDGDVASPVSADGESNVGEWVGNLEVCEERIYEMIGLMKSRKGNVQVCHSGL